MTNREDPTMVLVDYESTGLRPHADIPLELAALVVDEDLNIIDEMSMVIDPAAMPIWDDLDPIVKKMHTENGLIHELEQRAAFGREPFRGVEEVEDAFVQWLVDLGAAQLPMVGNNVANFDRPFMRVHMPRLESTFHYRNIDISTVKELCRRYNAKVFAASPKERDGFVLPHRALADCKASLEELDFYLDEFLMVDLP